MKESLIIHDCMGMYNTTCKIYQQIQVKTEQDPDFSNNLSALNRNVGSISRQIATPADNEEKRNLLQLAMNFQRSCEQCLEHQSSVDRISQDFNAWTSKIYQLVHMRAINLALNCITSQRDFMRKMIDELLSCPISLPLSLQSAATYTLSSLLNHEEPMKSYQLALQAFETYPSLLSLLTNENHQQHQYVYQKTDEIYLDCCPSCQGKGEPYYTSIQVFMADYSPNFSPARLWMKCQNCEQLYAYNFAANYFDQASASFPKEDVDISVRSFGMKPQFPFLNVFSEIVKKGVCYAQGRKRLLEVGIGGGEMIAVALELGCTVEAVELSGKQAYVVGSLLDVPIHPMDFLKFETENKYDIITMGDVIEHVTNPVAALQKAYHLLEEDGVLWISTPNYQSAFSRLMKFEDPMWMEPHHISYFSYDSFQKILRQNGFKILEYSVSPRYNGSMEIFSQKIS